jgi:AraC-like DNA-binding protein
MRTEIFERNEVLYGYLDTGARDASGPVDAVRVRPAESSTSVLLRPCPIGPLPACHILGDVSVNVRSRRRPPPVGDLLLGVVLSGRLRFEQDGRRAAFGPGDFVLYDGSRPFRVDVQGPYDYLLCCFRSVSAHVDPAVLGRITVTRDLIDDPAARALVTLLPELTDDAARLNPVTASEMADHVTAILRTVLRGSAREGRDRTGGNPMLTRILDYVDHHLDDADLNPEAIAQAMHVSVRSLHTLFHQEGTTVSRYLRRRRLERVRRDLADPTLARQPAYVIASHWGLGEASYFSKIFRAEFGMSPREFRKSILEPETATDNDT